MDVSPLYSYFLILFIFKSVQCDDFDLLKLNDYYLNNIRGVFGKFKDFCCSLINNRN